MKIKRIIDVSWDIKPGMVVWDDDGEVEVKRLKAIKDGFNANVSAISANLHTGTHADAPLHFVDNSTDISSVDLSRFIGFVKVFELKSKKCVTLEDIRELPIYEGDVVFFKTSNSILPKTGRFISDYVYIDTAAVRYLVNRKVKTVGVDYLSVGSGMDSSQNREAHTLFLYNSIGIVEGLNLTDVKEGTYMFSALPLRVAGSDGSPVRAVLLEIEE